MKKLIKFGLRFFTAVGAWSAGHVASGRLLLEQESELRQAAADLKKKQQIVKDLQETQLSFIKSLGAQGLGSKDKAETPKSLVDKKYSANRDYKEADEHFQALSRNLRDHRTLRKGLGYEATTWPPTLTPRR